MYFTLPRSIAVKSLAAFQFVKPNSYSFHRVWRVRVQLYSTAEEEKYSMTSPSTTALSIARSYFWGFIMRTEFLIIWVMSLFKKVQNCSCISWILANRDLKSEPYCPKPISRVFICLNCSLSTQRGRERRASPPPVRLPSSSMPSSSSKTSMWTTTSDPVTISGTFYTGFSPFGSLHLSPKSR